MGIKLFSSFNEDPRLCVEASLNEYNELGPNVGSLKNDGISTWESFSYSTILQSLAGSGIPCLSPDHPNCALRLEEKKQERLTFVSILKNFASL